MGRGKTHRQGDRERQRQEKLLGKKKRVAGASRKKKARNYRKRHRQQHSSTDSNRARAGTPFPSQGSPSGTQGCLVKQILEAAILGSQGHFLATSGPASIGCGMKCLPKYVPLPLSSSPSYTAWVVFPAQMPQIS